MEGRSPKISEKLCGKPLTLIKFIVKYWLCSCPREFLLERPDPHFTGGSLVSRLDRLIVVVIILVILGAVVHQVIIPAIQAVAQTAQEGYNDE